VVADALLSTREPAMMGRTMVRALYRLLLPMAALVVLLAVWEALVRVLSINPTLLPPPSRVFRSLADSRAALLPYSEITLLEILVGFAIGVAAGIPLGTLIVFNQPVCRVIYPLLVASQMVPKVAVAPLFVVWFGTGLSSKFLVAFLISFFPVVIATAVGLQSVDPDMVALFRSMGAGPLFTFTRLRLPAALPSIFGGLKVAMSLAVVGAVVGEFVAANTGLGYFLLFANGQLDTAAVFAGLLVLTAIGVVLYFLVEVLERLLVPAPLVRRPDERTATM
jgi:NitT/TauT family transport system permease protein